MNGQLIPVFLRNNPIGMSGGGLLTTIVEFNILDKVVDMTIPDCLLFWICWASDVPPFPPVPPYPPPPPPKAIVKGKVALYAAKKAS